MLSKIGLFVNFANIGFQGKTSIWHASHQKLYTNVVLAWIYGHYLSANNCALVSRICTMSPSTQSPHLFLVSLQRWWLLAVEKMFFQHSYYSPWILLCLNLRDLYPASVSLYFAWISESTKQSIIKQSICLTL